MTQIVRLVFLILFVATISGCGEIIRVPVGPEGPAKAERDELSQLIGQSQEAVVEKLGLPKRHFTLDDRQFMLYLSYSENHEVSIPWVIIPLPIPFDKEPTGSVSLRCLMIEIDSNKLVKQYDIQQSDPDFKDQSIRCLNQFFSKNEIKYFATFIRTRVTIDIEPGSDLNAVNPMSKKVITVAVLGSMNFDPIRIDPSTATFGPAQASPNPDYDYEDVNGNGLMDRVFHFMTHETGIACANTEATLNGETFFDQTLITGIDKIDTVGCS